MLEMFQEFKYFGTYNVKVFKQRTLLPYNPSRPRLIDFVHATGVFSKHAKATTPFQLFMGAKKVKFSWRSEAVVPSGFFPPSVQEITYISHHPWEPESLPLGLLSLLVLNFNQPLVVGFLPPSLTRLQFYEGFNQPLLPGVLGPNLQILYLGPTFNHPITEGVLPNSVRDLSLGGDFNQPLAPGVLPTSLQKICFGLKFCQDLPVGTFPNGLKQITFDRHAKPFVDGSIPPTVTHLEIGDGTVPIGVVPASVTHLKLGRFSEPRVLITSIPASITHVTLFLLDSAVLTETLSILPASVKHLKIEYALKLRLQQIPSHIEIVHLENMKEFSGKLPIGIKHITFSSCITFHLSNDQFPVGIETVTLKDCSNVLRDDEVGRLDGVRLYSEPWRADFEHWAAPFIKAGAIATQAPKEYKVVGHKRCI